MPQDVCLETEKFKLLIELYIDAQLKYFPVLGGKKSGLIDSHEAMKRIGITSPNTLKKYRDEGAIEFIQIAPTKIMFEEVEIERFINERKQSRF